VKDVLNLYALIVFFLINISPMRYWVSQKPLRSRNSSFPMKLLKPWRPKRNFIQSHLI